MFGWFGGGGGDRGKSYASMSVKFELFGHEKSQENHHNHFRVFNTSNSSPILLFCLRNFFLGNTKRRAPENDRDLSCQKLIWSHMVPFGANSDPSFRAQKLLIQIQVRSCVFSYCRNSNLVRRMCLEGCAQPSHGAW